MAVKRTNTKRSAVDMGQALSNSFNQYSGGLKSTASGPALEVLGTLDSAKAVGFGASLWIYNNSGAVGWVAFYTAPAAAPTPSGLTNAIPVPANSYIQVNSGTDNLVIGSAVTLGAYKVKDDTVLTIDDNQGN